jgi:transposase InsO family protein
MVRDNQVRILMKALKTEKTKKTASAKAGMDEKTARKYERLGKLPSEIECEHTWRTREDPLKEVWPELREQLEINPGLEAKTLFDYIQRKYSGRYQDGQLRTLQRRIKVWRALEGPAKEVFFPQVYKPGDLCQSDFTYMNKLGITISGQRFNHLIYHFILPYSNWETGTICFSESFESISEGLQNALWELGGVPKRHRTDRFSAAIKNPAHGKSNDFTHRYAALMRHYGLEGRMIQTGKPHENGDIEQRHYRFKKALEQSLLIRGSRDFTSRFEYDFFLRKLFFELNSGRRKRFQEELKVLNRLPKSRFDSCKQFSVKVGPSSTIRVSHNVYSVDSRLIGENIKIKLYAEYFEIWYGQRCLEKIPRLRGSDRHYIQYRHIIDWLVRKPGAFENYRYHKDMFPSHRFRMAYDYLKKHLAHRSSKEYLKILHMAARESETAVDNALGYLIDKSAPITFDTVLSIVRSSENYDTATDVQIEEIDISIYDRLLDERMVP